MKNSPLSVAVSGKTLRRWAVIVAASVTLSAPLVSQAVAQPIPFKGNTISINARGQTIDRLLADLFGQAGLKVKVSSEVNAPVNGVFVGPAANIWDRLSKAYGLVATYDGSIVRVYSQKDIGPGTYRAADPEAVVAQANALKLTDAINKVTAGAGIVIAQGTPDFLDRIERMAKASSVAVKAAPTLPPVAPPPVQAKYDDKIDTPLRANDMGALPVIPAAREPVRYKVLQTAGKRSPFESRMYFLKYRDAADRQVRSADRITTIPGVATLVAEQMGDGRLVTSATTNSEQTTESAITTSGAWERGEWRSGPPETDPNDASRPAGGDLDGPRISADKTNNAVIIRDRPEVMGVYDQLIANFDIEQPMIEIEAVILEVNTSRMKQLGIDWSLGVDALNLAFGGVAGPLGNGVIIGEYQGKDFSFLSRIKALSERGAVRVERRSFLTTPSNVPVVFDYTGKTYITVSGERHGGAIPVYYGLSINVVPSIVPDGRDLRIRMDIDLSDTQIVRVSEGGVPTTEGPKIATSARVRHGESVMIAGMTSKSEYDFKSKTPGLGDIPAAGQLFRKRNKGSDSMERLYLLVPRVISGEGAQVATGEGRRIQPVALPPLKGERKGRTSS